MAVIHQYEIQSQIQRGFVDRLGPRIKRMRRLYSRREWTVLRQECSHLSQSADRFGFPELSTLAGDATASIEASGTSRAQSHPFAKKAVENLLEAVDHVLVTGSLNQH